MTPVRFEPRYDQDAPAYREGLSPDFSKVLVVGNSQINRIVVSKIVERSGLKPVSEAPATAVRVLPVLFPGVVVLDGGANNKDCDCLMAGIAALRRITGKNVPSVILLTNRNTTVDEATRSGAIDAVVTKPFTTEQLQPVVDRLVMKAKS